MTNDELNLKRFGEKLRSARKVKGYSQDEVVERLGKKDRTAISEYESGKRRLYAFELPEYAAALGVPVTYFFGDVLAEGDMETAILEQVKLLPKALKRQVLTMLEAMTNKTMLGHREPGEDAWMRLVDGKTPEQIEEMVRRMSLELDKKDQR